MPRGGKQPTHEQSLVLRERFLLAYEKHMVIEDAIKEIGITRMALLGWRQRDERFRMAFEAVEAGITDKANKMAMKHAGLLPWSDEEYEQRKWATSNFRAVEVLLRRDPRYRDSGMNITNNVMALTINGVKGEEVKKLVTPDSPRAMLQDGEIEVLPEGADTKPDADVSITEKKTADAIPAVMAPLMAERMARYAERMAEGRE